MEYFFPQIQVKTKKKRNTFFLEFKWSPTLRCTPESNYWGDADVGHTQTIGGDTVKLLGGIYPPRVSAPLHIAIRMVANTIFKYHKLFSSLSAFIETYRFNFRHSLPVLGLQHCDHVIRRPRNWYA